MLPCEACAKDTRGARYEMGWFQKGQEPTEFCDRHVLVEYDTEHGGICHGSCPDETRGEVALIRVDRHFPIRVYVSDAQYAYGGNPDEIEPNPDGRESYFAKHQKYLSGVSNAEKPFNRSCTAHLGDEPQIDWEYLIPKFPDVENE